MIKPWFKSTAILGGITAAIGYVSDPRVLDVLSVLPLPEQTRARAAGIITAVGTLAAIFGLRRAIPDATLIRTDNGTAALHDPSGLVRGFVDAPRNEHGETLLEELDRRRRMDAAGEELRRTLEAREGGAGGRGGA